MDQRYYSMLWDLTLEPLLVNMKLFLSKPVKITGL